MSSWAGIGLKILATMLFTSMGAMVKALGDAAPLGQVIFARNFFALLPILLFLVWRGELGHGLKTSRPLGHAARAAIGIVGMCFGFAALQRLSLPDATAIGFALPIFTVVLSALLLGETVRIYRWSAVGVGLVGVLIMLWPYLSFVHGGAARSDSVGALLALASAVAGAFATIQVRRLTATEHTAAIVFYFSVIAAFLALLTLALGWPWPTPGEAALLIGIGTAGGCGQIVQTESFRRASASVIAPFDYFSMIWAIVIGYVLFGELPTVLVLTGAALVIGAGIFVIFREARLGLDRTAQRRVKTPYGG
jgi:drug/metabolite transporter (DMT)-like permease